MTTLKRILYDMSPLLEIALYLAPDIIPSQLKHAEMLPLFTFSVWEAAILPLSAVPEVGAEREVTVLPVSAYLGVGTEQFPAKATFTVDFFKF
jgi:hypothetical protein